MMSSLNPGFEYANFEELWRELRAEFEPAGYALARRLISSKATDIFIEIEDNVNYYRSIVIEAEGNWGELSTSFPRLSGLKCELSRPTENRIRLKIRQSVAGLSDMFEHFSWDLYKHVAAESEYVFEKLIVRLHLWSDFFKEIRNGISTTKAIGLYGELVTLRDLINNTSLGNDAALKWSGPSASLQDFSLGPFALEVKSSMMTGVLQASIVNERQLDTSFSERLFLSAHRIDLRSGGTGELLKEIIAEIRAQLSTDLEIQAYFNDQLIKVGYSDFDRSLTQRFSKRDTHWYEVKGTFPRIQESNLPEGLGRVSYTLDLLSCEEWEIDEEAVFAAISELFDDA